MNYYTKQTLLGDITLTEEKGFLTICHFGIKRFAGKYFLSETLNTAFSQLDEYLAGKRKEFTIPLNPKGTSFQQKVWSILLQIPYGETRSYKDIADKLGDKNASRAVGMANNKNPLPIFIPCHRVVNASGDIGGYSAGCDIKSHLLNIENTYK